MFAALWWISLKRVTYVARGCAKLRADLSPFMSVALMQQTSSQLSKSAPNQLLVSQGKLVPPV